MILAKKSYTFLKSYQIQAAWIRYDTRTILTMHEQKVTQSSHYSTENKRDNSDLIITGIKEDDAGIYICQINTEPIRNKVIFSILNMFQNIHTLNLYSALHSNDSTI